MKLEPKTKNAISLVGFLLGLLGIVYTLWFLIVESDPQATPLFVQSMMIIVGAYYLLIKDNDHYPPGTDKIVRGIVYFLFTIGLMISGLCFMSVTAAGASYFAGLIIFMLVLFFATTYKKFWEKRII